MDVLQTLATLSRELGREERRLAILGEGNTSALCNDGAFWVKASGGELGSSTASGFSRVSLKAVLELLEADTLSDEEVAQGLRQALCAPNHPKPSTETFLHALCLAGGARWVGHTHPVSVNSILCGKLGAEPFTRHIFPDAIVVCGRYPAIVPYVDPGFRLAQGVRAALQRYQKDYGQAPKLLLLENHGMVALGQTAKEVLNITLMTDKWARVLLGTYAPGGPQFLSEEEAERIDRRPDEAYRRHQLRGQA
jgi:rhamnose utilization protein RhaD (predicted bifunctional aldolase and dehydrogenase)